MTSPADRERLYDREVARAAAFGWGPFPRCELCECPIGPGQDWDISHGHAPAALGGDPSGIAHRRCNREDGAKYVTPLVAKAKRMARAHKGCTRSATPLPCGRNSRWRKRMDGSVVPRQSQSEMLAETLARRRILK